MQGYVSICEKSEGIYQSHCDWQQVEIPIKEEPGTFTLTLAVIGGEGLEVAKTTLWDD